MEKVIIIEKPENESGVYVIVNPITMKAYIGETVNFYRRWAEHIGSMFGLESSSNSNLMAEETKTFEIFPAIFADYKKKSNLLSKDWLIHETVMMYVFRKNGFLLYNGKDGKDNTGKERAFIIDEEIVGDVLKQKVIDYLNRQDISIDTLSSFEVNSWEELFLLAEEEMNKSFRSRFHISLTEFGKLEDKPNERIRVWCQRNTSYLKKSMFYHVTEKNAVSICKELYITAFSKRILATDLKKCGLKEISAEQFADMAIEGMLDRIIVSKYGAYYDQSVETILSTKIYDIKHNVMGSLQGIDIAGNETSGICFWALKRLDIEATRNFLSKNHTCKEARYVILRYTPSKKSVTSAAKDKNLKLEYMQMLNPQEGESIETFYNRIRSTLDTKPLTEIAKLKYVLGYADTERKAQKGANNKYMYPLNMFPEVVDKSEINKALLISELSFVNADYKVMDDLYDYFCSHTGKNGTIVTKELSTTLGSRKYKSQSSMSHCRAYIKEEKKGSLAKYLSDDSNYEKNGKVSFLLAKLEYPYIIALTNESVN